MPELIALLENAKVLGKFTHLQKQRLASLAIRRVLKRDEALYWEGDLWLNVLLIALGKLRSVIHSLDGRSYVVSTWEEGEEFWPHTIFDGEPMPSTLEAAQESVIYQWDGEDVLRILFDNSEAVRALLQRQIKLIRKRRDTIADLAFQPVTRRLAKLLLEQVPASENSAQRDLTLDQIASMVASSPEVVCRTLYQLQREGFLQVTRASITLHDRAALERLVSAE
jgi:CRP/FNR family cyclic AMP-dependent transcriptional regulator